MSLENKPVILPLAFQAYIDDCRNDERLKGKIPVMVNGVIIDDLYLVYDFQRRSFKDYKGITLTQEMVEFLEPHELENYKAPRKLTTRLAQYHYSSRPTIDHRYDFPDDLPIVIPDELQAYINRCLNDQKLINIPVKFKDEIISLGTIYNFEQRKFIKYEETQPTLATISALTEDELNNYKRPTVSFAKAAATSALDALTANPSAPSKSHKHRHKHKSDKKEKKEHKTTKNAKATSSALAAAAAAYPTTTVDDYYGDLIKSMKELRQREFEARAETALMQEDTAPVLPAPKQPTMAHLMRKVTSWHISTTDKPATNSDDTELLSKKPKQQ